MPRMAQVKKRVAKKKPAPAKKKPAAAAKKKATPKKAAPKKAAPRRRPSIVERVKRVATTVVAQAQTAVTQGVDAAKELGENVVERVTS